MTIYELLNMKSKNSVYKSVFIEKYDKHYLIVNVEAYDDTFINARDKRPSQLKNQIYKKLHNSKVKEKIAKEFEMNQDFGIEFNFYSIY